ncbi:D-ribose pyranase [Tessaracoccus lapidicaptus]|uniref:D-ribose pyranase n=1 Tax=Tessaracoccus lapidicaptus TaxID=1427523 RepID=A0A1C0AIM7_9ACTN|nr:MULTISPECIES: D-ribose pyranase [Tessaracoccus]AQX15665.1 D-ribose pyranase [Tessaracoccus sp. T2.5-30]OCL31947.1 D-ribose pyranase [Tessaracoccus lapidicaptus]VEP40048.1 D-ribose pyranase [Tessaracoccus lapidicaptus]
MKRSGLLNPDVASAIARLGHTDTFVIADCGLPIPQGVRIIDLSLVFGIPRFVDTLSALLAEVVVEGAVAADEARGGPVEQILRDQLGADPEWVPHADLKARVRGASFVIRTGESTPYANVILSCGVPF